MTKRTKPSAPWVGKTLRNLRTENGLTQEALARRAGVTKHTISSIEVGRNCATVATLDAILGAMGYEIEIMPMTAKEGVS
jgi:transcriptional regulator with XRE-family HTH domain